MAKKDRLMASIGDIVASTDGIDVPIYQRGAKVATGRGLRSLLDSTWTSGDLITMLQVTLAILGITTGKDGKPYRKFWLSSVPVLGRDAAGYRIDKVRAVDVPALGEAIQAAVKSGALVVGRKEGLIVPAVGAAVAPAVSHSRAWSA